MLFKYFDKGNIREVNYFKFCADIDRPQDMFPEYVAKNPKPEVHLMYGQLGVSTSEDVLNVLLKAYMDKGNVDEVNYYDFCEDVDSSDALFNVGRGYNHSFDYYPKTRPRPTGVDIKKDKPDDVDDVVAKLRQHCKEQRTRISEFFRDFDKLRSGYITEAQFRIGLNMSKIVLSGSYSKRFNFYQ